MVGINSNINCVEYMKLHMAGVQLFLKNSNFKYLVAGICSQAFSFLLNGMCTCPNVLIILNTYFSPPRLLKIKFPWKLFFFSLKWSLEVSFKYRKKVEFNSKAFKCVFSFVFNPALICGTLMLFLAVRFLIKILMCLPHSVLWTRKTGKRLKSSS